MKLRCYLYLWLNGVISLMCAGCIKYNIFPVGSSSLSTTPNPLRNETPKTTTTNITSSPKYKETYYPNHHCTEEYTALRVHTIILFHFSLALISSWMYHIHTTYTIWVSMSLLHAILCKVIKLIKSMVFILFWIDIMLYTLSIIPVQSQLAFLVWLKRIDVKWHRQRERMANGYIPHIIICHSPDGISPFSCQPYKKLVYNIEI